MAATFLSLVTNQKKIDEVNHNYVTMVFHSTFCSTAETLSARNDEYGIIEPIKSDKTSVQTLRSYNLLHLRYSLNLKI